MHKIHIIGILAVLLVLASTAFASITCPANYTKLVYYQIFTNATDAVDAPFYIFVNNTADATLWNSSHHSNARMYRNDTGVELAYNLEANPNVGLGALTVYAARNGTIANNTIIGICEGNTNTPNYSNPAGVWGSYDKVYSFTHDGTDWMNTYNLTGNATNVSAGYKRCWGGNWSNCFTYGEQMRFVGTVLNNSAAVISPNNTFSITFFLNDSSNVDATRRWITTTNGALGVNTVLLREIGGNFVVYLNDTLSITYAYSTGSNKPVNLGFYALVCDPAYCHLYANLTEVANNTNILVGAPQTGLYVGGYYVSGTPIEFMVNASMYDLRIVSRPLNVSELRQIYWQDSGFLALTNVTNASSGTIYPSLSPSTAYVNTTVQGNVVLNYSNASANGTVHWILYVNGSSYQSGTSYNITPGENRSLFNQSGYVRGAILILQTLSNMSDGGNISAANSSSRTISNLAPIMQAAYISNNATLMQNDTILSGAVMANDSDIYDNLSINYSWMKNGANQTLLAGNITVSQNTLTLFNTTAPAFSAGDNWSIVAYASDGTNISITMNSSNASVGATNGIVLCNATETASTITYNFLDEDTLTSINASFSSLYAFSQLGVPRTTSASGTNTTIYVCISPYNDSINATSTETANATGYISRQFARDNQTYSNVSINRTIYLVNSTTGTTVQITVKTTSFAPLANYTVALYHYYPLTGTFNLSSFGITDMAGITTQYISPTPTLYAIAVFDNNNVLQTNITNPLIAFCTQVTTTGQCIYTIYLGNLEGFDYGNINSPIAGVTNITGSNFCSYSNITNILNCTWARDSGNPIWTGINLTLRNGSAASMGVLTSNQTTGTTILVYVPSANGTYLYSFYATYLNSTIEKSFVFSQLIETGSILVNQPSNSLGSDGWLLTLLIVVVVALTSSSSPQFMVLLGGFAFLGCAAIGFITLSPFTFMGVLCLIIIIANWIKD